MVCRVGGFLPFCECGNGGFNWSLLLGGLCCEIGVSVVCGPLGWESFVESYIFLHMCFWLGDIKFQLSGRGVAELGVGFDFRWVTCVLEKINLKS